MHITNLKSSPMSVVFSAFYGSVFCNINLSIYQLVLMSKRNEVDNVNNSPILSPSHLLSLLFHVDQYLQVCSYRNI